MKELQYGGEAFYVDDRVAEALDRLALTLADSGIAADVVLKLDGGGSSVQFELGRDHTNGRTQILHAKSATGEGSHLGLEDI